MGRQFKQRFHIDDRVQQEVDPVYTPAPHGTCRVQVVRSVSDWSHGVLKENSIQNACSSLPPVGPDRNTNRWGFLDCQLIQEASHYIYIGTSGTRYRPEKLLTTFSQKTNSCATVSPSTFPVTGRI